MPVGVPDAEHRRMLITSTCSPRLRTALAVSVSALALLPAAASADVASSDGSTATVSATDVNETIVVSVPRPGVVSLTTDDVGPGCTRNEGAESVECPFGAGGVVVAMAGGNDHVIIGDGVLPDGALKVDLGSGDDQFLGGDAAESVLGGAGNDDVQGRAGDDALDGGDGDDSVLGAGGRDQLHGGAGNDTLDGDSFETPAGDLIDGGAGDDRAQGWTRPSSGQPDPPVAVTLNGAADDGRTGEGDDVERVTSNVSGTFVTSDAPDTLEVWSNLDHGASVIRSLGGNDAVTGGNNRETIDGGLGDDRLEGGYGDDMITGGPGRDVIIGDKSGSECGLFESCSYPVGNDVIDARDGEADNVTCGVGDDRATVDPQDTVAPDCEHVDRAAPGAVGGPPVAPGVARRARTKLGASVSKAELARALSRGLVVTVRTPGAGRLTARGAVRGRTVASGSQTVRRAGSAKVVLRFSKQSRRSLRRARSAKVRVAVKFQPRSGAAVTQSVTVTLRRR
jgi:hypothetical protein